MNEKELEKALKKDIERGINSGEYPELFNGNEVVQLMLQSQLLGRKEGREQATSDILKFLEKKCVHCLIAEELKQEIQGVKGE